MESIHCMVETPRGHGVKYSYDHQLACMELSKVLPAGLVFPFDFGFIPGTMGQDGDPLDVLIISEAPAFPGCTVKCRIIGMIKSTQRERDGDTMRNDRYIGIPEVSVLYGHITEMRQLPRDILRQLENFFVNYNEQAGKTFRPMARTGARLAMKALNKAQHRPKPTQLIQLLLPMYSSEGKPFPNRLFQAVKQKLLLEFGGVTVYAQSPAEGLWEERDNKVAKDRVLVYEVMASKIDRSFWEKYKEQLEGQFKQKELVVRQMGMGLL